MDIPLFEQLEQQQLITVSELTTIRGRQGEPVSVHWDLRTLLYLGITLVTTAVGILVYKNIDTIGHDVMIVVIGIACAVCFAYCLKKANPFTFEKVESPSLFFDYALLLGCLLLLTFIAYLQFEYGVFGSRWGLATFIPMVVLFITAYYFDHLGILSMAITNAAAWVGLTVTPMQLLPENDFANAVTIYAGLLFGAGLLAVSFISKYRNIKAHFGFTYKNFGTHILFISGLASLFHFEAVYLLLFPVFLLACFLFFKDAVARKSFYFLVITVLYSWIGISYVVVRLLIFGAFDMGAVYLSIIYFIISGIGLIRLLIHYNKKLKKDANL